MTKYRYNPERLNDKRLTIPILDRIREHSLAQIEADFRDYGFGEPPPITLGMVRIIIEAAMRECPELFK